jgi:hypothetical protein
VRAAVIVLFVVAGCHRSRDVEARRSVAEPLACSGMQGCTDRCRDGDDACVAACVARLTALARPFYDALAACVAPACAAAADGGAVAPCRAAASFACKMCVLAHCPAAASSCMAH